MNYVRHGIDVTEQIERAFKFHDRAHDTWIPDRYTYLIDFCRDYIRPTDVLLELGCQFGCSASIFSQFAKFVISVDRGLGLDSKNYLSKHDNILVLIHDSLTLSRILGYFMYDILYIDANHSESSVLQELKTLTPLARPNAVISGHDYGGEVKIAVEKFFGKPPIIVYKDATWVYTERKRNQ